jgi:uncharacterized protein
MGSRARRDQADAGSADLTPVDLDGGEPRLVAGRCVECGKYVFPLRGRCLSCGGGVERALLPARGTLWTWTTQGFEPKPPYVGDGEGEFVPYGVGYVEFTGYLRVEGRLTEGDPERLRIGMPMRVVAVTRGDRSSYAFAPE